MRLLSILYQNSLRDALQRYREALKAAQSASKDAQESTAKEVRATDELRIAMEAIVGRIREENNGSSS